MAVTLALHYTHPLLCQLSSRPLPQLRLYIKLTLICAPCRSTLTKLPLALSEVLWLHRGEGGKIKKVFFPAGCSFAHPPPCLAAPLVAAPPTSSRRCTQPQRTGFTPAPHDTGLTLPLDSCLTDVCSLFRRYCPASAATLFHHDALPSRDKCPAPPVTPWPHNSSTGAFTFQSLCYLSPKVLFLSHMLHPCKLLPPH